MSTPVTMDFADRLQELIAGSGKPIKELASGIGISSGALSKYQNDAAEPGIDALVKIANYFKVSTDWLVGQSDYPTKKTEELLASDLGISYEAISGIFSTKQLSELEPRCAEMLEGINQLLSNPNFHLLAMSIIGFENEVKKALSYEKDHSYDGYPIFCEEYPEGTVLLGFDSCEYSLQRLKERFVELAVELSGFNTLKDYVEKKRNEATSNWFSCQGEMSDE